MFKLRRLAIAVVLGGLLPALVPLAAGANTESVSDANDVAGPLDIHYAKAGHSGSSVTATIVTYGTWSPSVLKRGNSFAVLFDTNNDPKVIERWIIVYDTTKLVAPVADGNFHVIGHAKVSKPNARTVKVTVTRSLLGNPAGYFWETGAYFHSKSVCHNGCLDWTPNKYLLLHDITPPTVTLTSFPPVSTDVSATATFHVGLSVSDTGYSGLKSWTLQERITGTTTWSSAASGSSSGSRSPSFNGTEGNNYDFRVRAVDKQGNKTISPVKTVMVPFDDGDTTDIVYSGAGWTHGSSTSDDFDGTLSQSAVPTDSFSYTFTGSKVVVVYPTTTTGTATVTLDGTSQAGITEDSGGLHRRKIVYNATGTSPHTLVVTVASGTFAIDGVASR